MNEIEQILRNNSKLKDRCSESYFQNLAKAIEQYVIKARIEELKVYENLRNRKDDYEAPYETAILNISIMASERIVELEKRLKD